MGSLLIGQRDRNALSHGSMRDPRGFQSNDSGMAVGLGFRELCAELSQPLILHAGLRLVPLPLRLERFEPFGAKLQCAVAVGHAPLEAGKGARELLSLPLTSLATLARLLHVALELGNEGSSRFAGGRQHIELGLDRGDFLVQLV